MSCLSPIILTSLLLLPACDSCVRRSNTDGVVRNCRPCHGTQSGEQVQLQNNYQHDHRVLFSYFHSLVPLDFYFFLWTFIYFQSLCTFATKLPSSNSPHGSISRFSSLGYISSFTYTLLCIAFQMFF